MGGPPFPERTAAPAGAVYPEDPGDLGGLLDRILSVQLPLPSSFAGVPCALAAHHIDHRLGERTYAAASGLMSDNWVTRVNGYLLATSAVRARSATRIRLAALSVCETNYRKIIIACQDKMFNNQAMNKKERFLGLRLTGALAEALESYCAKEERSLSSAVRFLVAKELSRLGYLSEENEPKKKTKAG